MAAEVKFFASNILIAASVVDHPRHRDSAYRLALVRDGSGACAAHTLAETYNTLTRYPKGCGLHPEDASMILREASKSYRLVSLTSAETARAIEDAASRGLAGNLVFYVLLIACARKSGAEVICTSNVRHFRRVAPDLESRIMLPGCVRALLG